MPDHRMPDQRTFLDWDHAALPAAAALLADAGTRAGSPGHASISGAAASPANTAGSPSADLPGSPSANPADSPDRASISGAAASPANPADNATAEPPDSLDLSSVLVVLPGGRAARRLKELLVEEADRRRLRLVPPQITTPGALPESLYAPAAPLVDEGTSLRLWLRQLQAAVPEDLELLFPHPPAAGDVRGWIHLARTVRTLHETVGAAGRSFADVAANCDDSLLYDDTNRWNALARLQRGYAAALDRIGRADRDFARIRALATKAIASDLDVWLIGIAEMPVVLRGMLRQFARSRPDALHVLVHAPASEAGRFDELGCIVPGEWIDADIPLADDQLAIVGHPSNQAAEAARMLASLGGEFAADEIVIGVPDPEVVPYIEQQLAAAGVRARYAAGMPVTRSAAYRLLDAIADVLQDGSFDSVAALARHPAFGEWLHRKRWQIEHPGAAAFREPDGWLDQLDRFRAERLPVSIEHDLPGPDGRGRTVVEALRVALGSDAFLGSLRGERPLREWMPAILELLLEVHGDGPRSRDVPEERRLLGAAEAFRDAALAHTRVAPDLDVPCDAAAAVRILLDDVSSSTLPPASDEAAIELLGWLELHLDDAPVAVLTGMNEPFVPEAINADAFLPNALRSRLGIIDNDMRHARDAYQLTAMLHARRVHAIAGRRTVLGDPLRPSRLMLAASRDALARRVHGFLAEDADRPRVTAATTRANTSAFVLPPQKAIALESVADSFRVTEFRDILADPYAWALMRVMGGESVDDAARELDPLRFGSIAHAVLERFGRSDAAAWDDADRIAAHLEQTLDAYVGDMLGATLPAVTLQVEQLRLRLRAFAQRQAAWIREGWRTVGIECNTPEGGAPFEVDGTAVRLRGRIDRIDYHAGRNEWALFDYKTSEKPTTPESAHRRSNGDWIDLQLPLYRAILPHVLDEAGNAVVTSATDASWKVGYVTLCGDPAEIEFRLATWTDIDLDTALDAARDAVRTVRRNVFAFDGITSDWLSDDMAALLGRDRLVREDEELAEEVVL